MKVACVRPGRTAWDVEGRLAGSLDVPLSDEGASRIKSLASDLRSLSPVTVYCADSEPARASALILADALGVRCRCRPELDELNLGLWQGLLTENLARKHPKAFRRWQENPFDILPPGGEPVNHVLSRVRSFVGFLERRHPNSDVVVVAPVLLGSILAGVLARNTAKDLPPVLSSGYERCVVIERKVKI